MKEYKLRNACFVCTTPYQVIGAVSIVKSESIDADVYIFGTFSDHIGLSSRLEKLNIFNNVYTIEEDNTSFLGKGMTPLAVRARALFQIAFPKRAVSDMLANDVAYETFYSSSRAHGKLLMQRELQKRNPQMRIVIYEDGLGSYLEDSHVLRTSKGRRIIERIMGWKLFKPELVSIQLHLPEIAKLPAELQSCRLSEMPNLDWQLPENVAILKEISGVEDNESHNEKVILFDNVRGSTKRKEMFEKIDECYQVIIDIFGSDNVLFKGHPRSVEKPALKMHSISKQTVPMEVFYAEMDDLESRILIAYNSTATYTPKIFFDKEPWVINLHRIVGPPLQKNAEELFSIFLPTYKKQGKMLAPNSIEELKQMLSNIITERN